MKVTLLNPEEVVTAFAEIGKFASICKNDCDAKIDFEKIGLHCVRANHGSPCRSFKWRFRVEDISRVCSHQLVRHSIGVAINQQSGVFMPTEVTEDNIVIPPTVEAIITNDPQGELAQDIDAFIALSNKIVSNLRNAGCSNSDSRYFAPEAICTSMNIAFSPEALRHLCHERLCTKAQWEIRKVARAMANEVCKVDPRWKEFLVPKCILYNGCREPLGCGYFNKVSTNPNGDKVPAKIEDRLINYKCENCGVLLYAKDDDAVPGILVTQTDGLEHFLCRNCVRENGMQA